MGHTTHSWAAPEAAAAIEIWKSEALSPCLPDNMLSTLPYTPNKMAFCNATAARGGAMPLNKPNTWKIKQHQTKIYILLALRLRSSHD